MDWVLLALLVITLLAVVSGFYQLVRQQGRLLLRLENLEARLPGGSDHAANGAGTIRGLEVGTAAPPFRLPDAAGNEVALADFRGKRVFLVHWSTECGFCELIAPDLAKLEPRLRRSGVELVLLSYGGPEENTRLASEHGLECPILLQRPGEQIELFRGLPTPVAYFLDEEARVSAPLAVGAEDVPVLAEKAAAGRKPLPSERGLGQSRIEREGLKRGTRAPTFTLPDVHGRAVALEDYRGRHVMLVFSDPQCGPCDALITDLNALHRKHGDRELAIVMVGRGDAAANRAKVDELAVEFPVVLQQRWKLSKEYGIFATPVGFLIDDHGVIAANVARGGAEIVALFQENVRALSTTPSATT